MPTFLSDPLEMPSQITTDSDGGTDAELQSAVSTANPESLGMLAQTALGVTLGIPNLVDNVTSSVGLTDSGQVNDAALNFLESSGLRGIKSLARRSETSADIASAVYGVIGTELITRRITAPGSAAMRIASKIPGVRRLAALDAQYANALTVARSAELASARSAAQGAEQFIGRFGTGDAIGLTVNQAKRNVRVAAAKVGLRHGAISEGILVGTMNQNDILFTDSTAWNTAFGALGVALPAGIEWIATGYKLRKIASSDEVIQATVRSLDPAGSETVRTGWLSRKVETSNGVHNSFGGRFTDEITQLLAEAQTLRAAPIEEGADPRILRQNREAKATQLTQLARERVGTVIGKGLSSDGRTRATIGKYGIEGAAGTPGVSNHVLQIMDKNPSGFYLLEELGATLDEIPADELVANWELRLADDIKKTEKDIRSGKLTKDELTQARARRRLLADKKTWTPVGFVDGERMPISELRVLEGFTPPKPNEIFFTPNAANKAGNQNGFWTVLRPNAKTPVGTIDSNLMLTIKGNKSIESLDHYDLMRMYRMGNQVAATLAKSKTPIRLGENPTWFQLDLAEEILTRSDDIGKVVFPSGMTRESAQVESFAQKAEALRRYDEAKAAGMTRKGRPLSKDQELARLRVMLNLPRNSAYEMGVTGHLHSAATTLLKGMSKDSIETIKGMSLGQVRETVSQWQRLGDLAPTSDGAIRGNSFTYGLDRAGQEMTPLIGYMRPARRFEWIIDNVSDRVASSMLTKKAIMLDAKSDPYTQAIARYLDESPDTIQAAQTQAIRETQLAGAFTDSASNSLRGAAGNSVLTSEFAARDSMPILAANRLRDGTDRISQAFVSKLFTDTFGPTFNLLANPRNRASNVLLDTFHSNAGGWDLAANAAKNENGFWAFRLADTEHNQIRWREMTGGNMPKGQTLTNGDGVEVVLDDLGMTAQKQFNQISDQVRASKNTLLRSQGMRELESRTWYTPGPRVQGKFVGFVYDANNRPVRGMAIIAQTQKEYAQKELEMAAKLESKGLGHTIRSMSNIKQFASIWDRSIAEMVDSGTTALQSGKRARGGLTQPDTTIGAFGGSVQYMREQLMSHGRDLIEVQFEHSIKAAQSRSLISDAARPEGSKLFTERGFQNAHDLYIEGLLGTSKLHHEKSLMGKLVNGTEGFMDQLAQKLPPGKVRAWTALSLWQNRANPWSTSKMAQRDFKQLVDELGEHMPFSDSDALASALTRSPSPYTAERLSGAANSFATALLLRVGEVGHAIVNVSGLVTTMPAVVREMAPRVGESAADHLARIGHVGIQLQVPGKGHVGILDMQKLMGLGFKDALSKAKHADWEDLVNRGMVEQSAMEFHRHFGAIEGRNSLQRFLLGDPSIADAKGIKDKFTSKGLVGWTSVLTDSSENFSRAVASMTGLRLADAMGVTSREARLSIAHAFANKVIANYNPQNRPAIFQGAFGGLIGLFKAYMVNYHQRLFRYVETKDMGALMTQVVAQAGVFGVKSVPGWTQLNSMRGYLSGDGDDLNSEMRETYGDSADWLMHGTISNLPTLFGAPAINLYTRGDANFRMPGAELLQSSQSQTVPGQIADQMPAISVIRKLVGGIGEGVGALIRNDETLTATRLGEIAANAIANRPIAGMIEQGMVNGFDTDGYGQVVSETRGAAEAAYRVIGLRSVRQSVEIEQFFGEETAQEYQASLDERLRLNTRAAIRAGRLDDMYDIFREQYIEKGGSPDRFKAWLKDQAEAALETRSERRLESALNSKSDKAKEIVRLIDSGVDPSDEGENEFESAFANNPIESEIAEGDEYEYVPDSSPSDDYQYVPN